MYSDATNCMQLLCNALLAWVYIHCRTILNADTVSIEGAAAVGRVILALQVIIAFFLHESTLHE